MRNRPAEELYPGLLKEILLQPRLALYVKVW